MEVGEVKNLMRNLVCDFHRGNLGVVIAGIVYGIVCTEGVLVESPMYIR